MTQREPEKKIEVGAAFVTKSSTNGRTVFNNESNDEEYLTEETVVEAYKSAL